MCNLLSFDKLKFIEMHNLVKFVFKLISREDIVFEIIAKCGRTGIVYLFYKSLSFVINRE